MSSPADEIERVATGSLVQVEMWQQHLREAGVESQIVGEDLSSSFGSALTDSIELWVRREDFERAQAVLQEVEGAGKTPNA